jgi:hypothetical protein
LMAAPLLRRLRSSDGACMLRLWFPISGGGLFGAPAGGSRPCVVTVVCGGLTAQALWRRVEHIQMFPVHVQQSGHATCCLLRRAGWHGWGQSGQEFPCETSVPPGESSMLTPGSGGSGACTMLPRQSMLLRQVWAWCARGLAPPLPPSTCSSLASSTAGPGGCRQLLRQLKHRGPSLDAGASPPLLRRAWPSQRQCTAPGARRHSLVCSPHTPQSQSKGECVTHSSPRAHIAPAPAPRASQRAA